MTGRELSIGRLAARYLQLKPSDYMHTCMPLYHGAVHGLCVGPSIHAGHIGIHSSFQSPESAATSFRAGIGDTNLAYSDLARKSGT